MGKDYLLDKNEMIKKLNDKFLKDFMVNLIISLLITILVFVVTIIGYNQFIEGKESFQTFLMCLFILIVMIAVTIITMVPFIKDLRLIKLRKSEEIKGYVIKYRKVVHGGDPTTYSYHPVIKDADKEWIEVEVKADNTELNKTYHCLYLPNTKLAVCRELLHPEESAKL